MNPKLWVALSGGKVVVFDAASWSMLQDCIQVGESQLVRADMLHSITRSNIYLNRNSTIVAAHSPPQETSLEAALVGE